MDNVEVSLVHRTVNLAENEKDDTVYQSEINVQGAPRREIEHP